MFYLNDFILECFNFIIMTQYVRVLYRLCLVYLFVSIIHSFYNSVCVAPNVLNIDHHFLSRGSESARSLNSTPRPHVNKRDLEAVLGLVSWISHVNATTLSPVDDAGLKAAIDSNAYFSRNLFQVVGNSDSNMVMSPLSAQLALALANLGARGSTANQISTALNIQQNVEPDFAQLIELLQENNDVEVRIANRAYASQAVTLRPEFVKAARDTLNADALSVTFGSSDTEAAINLWVEEITNGKIKDMVEPGSLDESTVAVLINALYFNAKWYSEFNDKSTKEFHDEKFRFLILLPDNSSSLAALETAMSTTDLNDLMQRTYTSDQQTISVPKIELDVSVDLNEPFEKVRIISLML
ncbi:hypothetical protein B566_EDAN000792 [Ephemera danica]|nr:hypothetical protein B566_EDAN000792 [Ephemera danica]